MTDRRRGETGHDGAAGARRGRGPLILLAIASAASAIAWALAGSRATRRYVSSRGSRRPGLPLTRCAIHGIAYDADKETCPACSAEA